MPVPAQEKIKAKTSIEERARTEEERKERSKEEKKVRRKARARERAKTRAKTGRRTGVKAVVPVLFNFVLLKWVSFAAAGKDGELEISFQLTGWLDAD